MSPDKASILKELNQQSPRFVGLLGGELVDFDHAQQWARFDFTVSEDYCHSGDIVQGGFVTAMLDIAMSHAVFVSNNDVVGLSSLEIKTTYLETTRAGRLRVEGTVLKNGYKTVFLEGRVYNGQNQLTATASTVAKIKRQEPKQK